MNGALHTSLAALACLASMSCASEVPTLKGAFAGDFRIGASLGSVALEKEHYQYPVREDADELAVLAREFNSVTAENSLKWQYLQPREGFFNFAEADAFVALAERLGLDAVGHVLIWHDQTPDWVFKDESGETATRELLIDRMRSHIHTIVGRYRGRIKSWDVVNEAVQLRGGEGSYRESPWFKIIGPEFIELAFRFAHEADPDAELLYNDYSMTDGGKTEFVAEMVRGLKAKGVPIHGVGMQSHWHLEYPSLAEVQHAIDLFAAAGVSVSITELDIGVLPLAHHHQGADIRRRIELQDELNPYVGGVPSEVLDRQADRYAEIVELLLQNREHVERVTWWGISDRHSWLNDHPVRGRTAYPLLFDRAYQPKPAYHKLLELKVRKSP